MSIESKNLVFRAIEESDLPLMVKWRNDPLNNYYFYEHEPLSMPMQKMWFEKYLKGIDTDKIFIIDEKSTKNTIGMVSIYHIDWRNRKAEWGRIFLEENFRGKGYGKEIDLTMQRYAFETLNLNKLYREAFSFNELAIGLYEKMGSKIEGILREHIFRHGKYQDVIIMSILAEEYWQNKDKFKNYI